MNNDVRMLNSEEMDSLKGGFWSFVVRFVISRIIGIFSGTKVSAPGCTPEYNCFPPRGGGDIYLPPEG